ncbi:hypothetical protein ACMA1D_00855 [Streptomyces sp. 796.1]|uniref:hypothetical protein n=1 Tax=Streptomyces sp. 796.1 TaxID=3163029 RepID=UPI0039C8CAAB
MFELSRVLLRGVGPQGARYEDVLLDFSGHGPVVANGDNGLFGLGEAPRRPSPASLIFLENGGGKSVLIKLIFSVVLPGRRNTVGTTNTKVLDKFVLAGDVAHIALEWTHARTGSRLITAKVSQWREDRPSASSTPREVWYHFTPGRDLSLDTLPIQTNGHYRGLDSYTDVLRHAQETEPRLGLRMYRIQNEWTERLEQLGLDPELFRYQRNMNTDEGEAADAFSTGSDLAFVNFLLTAVLPVEPARKLADIIDGYAEKLADRGAMTLERDFVRAVLDVLGPLDTAEEARKAAAERESATRRAVDQCIGQVRVRAAREREVALQADELVRRLKDDVRRSGLRTEHAAGVAGRLRILVADLRCTQTGARHRAAQTGWQRAKDTLRAWQAVQPTARYLDAVETVKRLRHQVATTEAAARPALQARDAAAQRLVGALHAMARKLRAEVERHDTLARGHEAAAVKAQQAHDQAVSAAAGHEAKATALQARMSEVADEVRQAEQDGTVPDGLTVSESIDRAETTVTTLKEGIAGREASVARLEAEHGHAVARREAALKQLHGAERRLDLAREAHQAAHTRMTRLARDLAEAGLYSGQEADFDGEATGLVSRLSRARDQMELARIEVRVAAAGDARALASLELTELLPASPEAVRACELLNAAGISACTGWQYLASIPGAERRKEIVDHVPQLTTGVLINRHDQLADAREVLENAEAWPTGFVGIGSTQAIYEDADRRLPAGVSFVVPAHPALYDKAAAQTEHTALSERQAQYRDRLAELDETLRAHQTFLVRIDQWRTECPAGHLALLGEERDNREEEVSVTRLVVEQHEEALKAAALELKQERERIPPLREQLLSTEIGLNALRALRRREEQAVQWATESAAHIEATQACRTAAEEAATEARTSRDGAAQATRQADQTRAAVQRVTEELTPLPAYDPEAGDEPSDIPLEVLRLAHRKASEEYDRVSVGADLKADLRHAELQERDTGEVLRDHTEEARETARALLKGPEGTDTASRAAALVRSEDEVEKARRSMDALRDELQRHRAALDQLPPVPDDIDLAPYGEPQNIADGEELITHAERGLAQATQKQGELQHHLEAATVTQASARQSSRDFKTLVDLFGEPGTTDTALQPFEGTAADARAHYDGLRAEHESARAASNSAEHAVREGADRLAGIATDAQFAKLRSPSQQIMARTERSHLPRYAGQWAADLRPRLKTLEIDLESIGRHRKQIVQQLGQQVTDALRTLRRAERLSRLPEGLGSWSGAEFLRIRFAEIDEAALFDRMSQLIDEIAEETTRKDSRWDARQLILKGVAAAAGPKGFRVTVLKPDQVLDISRVRVSEIKEVFSGGQVLTAAIVLYCTMAALRANDRGRMAHQHAGVLFLDNPIGRASALYLLRLQQSVAKALGVQLIYTTGLGDLNALDAFPLVIRLRNDADLRARRKYLRVVGEFAKTLDGSLTRTDRNRHHQGQVTAARYFHDKQAGETER